MNDKVSSKSKRIEDSLRESEEMYRGIVELTPDGIVTVDTKGVVTSCNTATTMTSGFSKDEIVGKHISKLGFLRAKDIPKYLKVFGSIIRGKVPEPFEIAWQSKDGTPHLADVHVSLMKKEGKTIGIQAMVRDITERKQAQEALRKSEEKYRSIIELAPDGIVTANMKGVVTSINPAFSRLTGFSSDEIVGKRFTKLATVPKRDFPKYLKLLGSILRGTMPKPFEFVYNHKNGTSGWGEARIGILEADGRKSGFQVILRDITERRMAEEALRNSENKSRMLLENLPQKIFSKDKNSVYISCNENYARDLKIKSNEITGKTDYDFYPKELAEKYRVDDQRIMKSGKTEDIEEEYIQDGHKIFVHTVKTPVKDENGNVVGVLGIFWDTTERKKMEEEIKNLARFPSENPNPVLRLNREGIILYANDAGKTLLQDWGCEVVDRAPKFWRDVVVETLSNQSVKSFDLKLGKQVYSIVVTPVMGAGYANIYGIDITERKKAEEELIRVSNAVKMSADSIVIGDLDAKIIDVNEVTMKMYGTDNKRDLIGKSSFDLIAPEDREKAVAGMKEVLEKEYIKGREYNIITKDDSRIPVEMNTAIMKDADGKPIGFVAISRDITERKEMEETLRQYSEHLEELVKKRTEELLESERRYSVLVEEAGDGVAIAQAEKVVFANKRLVEIVGYSRDELIGLPFENLLDEKYHKYVKGRFEQMLRAEAVVAAECFEIGAITKTSERVPVELCITRIHSQGRPAVLAIIRDIRERKRMEEEHWRLEKLATIGELATMVAHDLRNPLTSIRNANYYIKNTCPHHAKPECKAALEMFDIIEQGTLFANNIINDLLDFAAKRPLQKEKQDINKIVDSSITISNIPENIKIERKFAKKAIATVDEKQLQRVFLNLTRNAVQAMPDGGKLTVKTSETKDRVEIEFRDTGIGIADENMTKLFTPLFTTKAKGIGMGLAICKKIVEEHDGTIDFESKVGQGTTFTIKLPKKEEANNQ
jgi:PAS domain S-box-containing protein